MPLSHIRRVPNASEPELARLKRAQDEEEEEEEEPNEEPDEGEDDEDEGEDEEPDELQV